MLEFDLLVYAFGQIPLVVVTWMCMFLSTLVVPYVLLSVWASVYPTSNHRTLWTVLAGSLLLLYQGLCLGFLPTYVVVKNGLPPASCFILILEQVLRNHSNRIFFLSHSVDYWMLCFLLHCVYLNLILVRSLIIFEGVYFNFTPQSSCCCCFKQVRLIMKAHSFIRENVPRVLSLERNKASKNP